MSSLPAAPDAERLLDAAREALQHAHAPYSRFRVGAAVIDERGRMFTGANVENASYGLAMCAERVAIFSAIAAGARAIVAIAVTAEGTRAITPCGACRQVMAEFCEADAPMWAGGRDATVSVYTVGELLPNAFLRHALQDSDTPPKSG